jgi:hypothetical protein
MSDPDRTTLDLDDVEPDEDDLRSFSDFEVDQLHSPWEPPPGDRLPSRKEWKAMSRVDRYRWRVAFGNDWQFGAPRGPRTAEDWKKLPDDRRTAEVFNALSRAAKAKLQDEGFDPTTLETPVRVSEGNEDVDEPAPITDEHFRPTDATDEMFAHLVQRQAAENEPLLRRLDAGDFESVGLGGERIAPLRAQSAGPDSPERGEAVQRLHFLLTTAAERTMEAAPFIPVSVSYRNLGPRGVRTVERDSLGRERIVSEMSAAEVAAALEGEKREGTEEFADVSSLTIEDVAKFSPAKRRRLIAAHPALYDELLAGASRFAEFG